MKNLFRTHPLISFFVMAFIFSWIAVLPRILNPAIPLELIQILGAFAGPTLAAIIVIASLEGRKGLGVFFKRYVQWRAGLFWWLFVLFGILISLTLVATALLGISVLVKFVSSIGILLPMYLLTLVVGTILGPLWEEPGWRGFALPRLQERFGPLIGSAILGVMWAFWHLPAYAGGWMTGSLLPVILGGIAFSFIMTWVYNNTRGSILLMILLHSASNASLSVGGRVLPSGLPLNLDALVSGGWVPVITYAILAGLILAVTRGQLSYRQSAPVPADLSLEPSPLP